MTLRLEGRSHAGAEGCETKRSKKSDGKAPREVSSKRELINTGTDQRDVGGDAQGQFKESDDVGRSLAADVRQHAKTHARKGQVDRAD